MSFAVIQWFLLAGSFQPSSARQDPCAYRSSSNYCWAGAQAQVSVLSPIKGEIHQNRPGQGKFGICSFKGIYIRIKMQFSSEI